MDHRTAVAMSGGVDSSAAALLLRREGHDLAGVTLKLVDSGLAGLNGESACCSLLRLLPGGGGGALCPGL